MHSSGAVVPQDYWTRRLKRRWGLHGVGYVRLGLPYNRWLYKLQEKVFFRHVTRLPLDWDRTDVLEVGSGTGFYASLWRRLGARSVTITDLSPLAMHRLRASFPECDCRVLDIGDDLGEPSLQRSYDIVSAFAVLYHILKERRYRKAFQNAAQLVRPGGYFIFTENALHGSSVQLSHQVSRPLSEIEGLLNDCGFEIRVRAPMFVLMAEPVDSSNWFRLFWRATLSPVRLLPVLGGLYGALLYRLDLWLTDRLAEGPTTELFICERKGSPTRSPPSYSERIENR